MRCQWFWSNFGQPVYLSSCVAGEFAWYVLLWNLLPLGWYLVSVVGIEVFDELLSVNVHWIQEFSGVSLFGLSLLLLVFSLILTVASRLLHLYSTNDNTLD